MYDGFLVNETAVIDFLPLARLHMQCTVYKSIEKFDHYLFIESEGNFSRVPQQLLDMLGQLVKVIDFELYSERKLARANVADVMQNLNENGYYLQLPPTD